MRSCSTSLRRAKPLLGTLVELSVGGEFEAGSLVRASDAAFAAIRQVQALMSFHDPASDVSRLNRSAHAGPLRVDARTWAVLARAEALARASGGAFDVTIAHHLVDWGFLPAPSDAPAPDPTATWQAIELLADHHVRFRVPLWIDLGGIAKGYAVDAACAALRALGVRDYVVNAGGDLAIGARPAPVFVRDPADPKALAGLGSYADVAIATSATYFAGSAGAALHRHPIVAPAAGVAADYEGSLTVIAPDAMTADALTKVWAVSGPAALPLLAACGARGVRRPGVAPCAPMPLARSGSAALRQMGP